MQLLKGLFAILVMLNIIVFANVVYQKINGQRAQHGPQVVAVPVGTGADEQAAGATGKVVAPSSLPAPKREMTAAAPATTPPPTQKLANCSAQITIPEDAYHRLKNFIGNWNHVAVRSVVENKASAQSPAMQYQVLVATSSDEVVQQLRAAGLNASPQGGSISLGVYPNIERANAVRGRAIAAGVSGVVVSEQGGAQSALTRAQYTLTFRNIDAQQTQKISEVLGRYGTLRRSTCSQ